MKLQLVARFAIAWCAALVLSPAAHAEDYYDALKRLTGQRFTVVADCSDNDPPWLTDGSKSAAYLRVEGSHPYDEAFEDCGAEVSYAAYEIAVFSNAGKFAFRYVGPGDEANAETFTEIAAKVQGLLAPIDSITGYVGLDYSFFTETNITDVPISYNGVSVQHSGMPDRETIDYLDACWLQCDRVTLSLEPITVSAADIFDLYLVASGWSEAGPAVASATGEEYFTVINELVGQRFTVNAACAGNGIGYASLYEEAAYFYLVAPEDTATGPCSEDGAYKAYEIEIVAQYGGIGLRQVGLGDESKAETLSAVAARIAGRLASVDRISGSVQSDGISLDSTVISQRPGAEAEGVNVYTYDMPGRTGVDYLRSCYQICEQVTLSLLPIEFNPRGFDLSFNAIGWSEYKGQ